jgi:sulfatase modifying factor 1
MIACGRVASDGSDAGALVDVLIVDIAADSPSNDLPPSCLGLASTCGPNGIGSCCKSLSVAGGTYARSYDVSGDGMYPSPSQGATMSDFQLDAYEITVGRFRKFVAARQGTQANPPLSGVGAHPRIIGSGWDAAWTENLPADTVALLAAVKCDPMLQTWTDVPSANESRPMVCLSWYEAMAFCAWDGGFLPTEAEWNYAATGGDEQRAYPWSSPPGFLGIDDTRVSYQCNGDGMTGCTVTDLVVVGTKSSGDGRWGQSDLAGNVWEWALDWYTNTYPQNPCIDCANLSPDTDSVIRGGSFLYGAAGLRTGNRNHLQPATSGHDIGARCARL